MTQKQFEKEVKRLTRRLRLMQDARNGDVKLRAIPIPKCVVPEHTRAAHTRYIAPRGWKSRPG